MKATFILYNNTMTNEIAMILTTKSVYKDVANGLKYCMAHANMPFNNTTIHQFVSCFKVTDLPANEYRAICKIGLHEKAGVTTVFHILAEIFIRVGYCTKQSEVYKFLSGM